MISQGVPRTFTAEDRAAASAPRGTAEVDAVPSVGCHAPAAPARVGGPVRHA